MNRGSSIHSVYQHRKRPGFNEAPIHESGKCVAAALGGLGRPRFNEAPIHESGKCKDVMSMDAVAPELQ